MRRYVPRRHGQLQLLDRPPLRGRRPAHLRRRDRRRPQRSCSTTSPATAARCATARCVVAPRGCARSCSTSSPTRPRTARDGRIMMKMNSLVDPDMIEALYAASRPGCEIDLVVRGICCLLPGVPGMSEQHPRALDRRPLPRALPDLLLRQRRRAPAGRSYFIGSADLMPRNLDRRVEVLVTVADSDHQRQLDEVLDAALAAETRGWELGPDAHWRPVGGTAVATRRPPVRAGPPAQPAPDPSVRPMTDEAPDEREVKLSAWPGFRLPDLRRPCPGWSRRRRRSRCSTPPSTTPPTCA